MLQRIKTLVATTLSSLLLLVPGLMMPVAVYADNPISNAVCTGVTAPTNGSDNINIDSAQSGTCDDGNGDTSNTLGRVLKLVVNILSIVVGFVAVIMIIVAGFRYITSGGESGKVTGAKNAIVYAVIGLIIVALAQIIVRFVISRSNTITQ